MGKNKFYFITFSRLIFYFWTKQNHLISRLIDLMATQHLSFPYSEFSLHLKRFYNKFLLWFVIKLINYYNWINNYKQSTGRFNEFNDHFIVTINLSWCKFSYHVVTFNSSQLKLKLVRHTITIHWETINHLKQQLSTMKSRTCTIKHAFLQIFHCN